MISAGALRDFKLSTLAISVPAVADALQQVLQNAVLAWWVLKVNLSNTCIPEVGSLQASLLAAIKSYTPVGRVIQMSPTHSAFM